MTRSKLAVALLAVTSLVLQHPAPASAQEPSVLQGRWNLNRDLSEFPREIGFDVDWVSADGTGVGSRQAGGRGGRGSRGGAGGSGGGAARPFIARRESEDDVKRLQVLTAEVRNPPAHLTIVETATTVTITDDRGQSRTFHPEVREESLRIEGVSVGVTAKREAGHLIVVYSVEQDRQLRYTYYQVPKTSQLAVDVQFVERGGGDSVRRIYEPAGTDEVWPAPVPTATAAANPPGVPPASKPGSPPPVAPDTGSRSVAAAAGPAADAPQNQKPDGELKGLTDLGIVVEDLSPEATACGLNQKTLETTLSKRLTDAGFKVRRDSDEDSYFYVNINTAKLSTGLCVSRYDVFVYTHATAKLTYQQTPALVQVSLLHTGGIGGGAPAAHAATVLHDVLEYVDQFSTRIHDASK